MQGVIEPLIELLTHERDMYKEILEVSKKKQDIISDGNIEELDGMVKLEQVFLVRLGELERKRKSVISELADKLQKQFDELVLSDILPICSDSQRSEIERIQVELRGILEQQIQLNEINHKLIDTKLQAIGYAIDMMSGERATNNYGATGEQQGRDVRNINIIDRKA